MARDPEGVRERILDAGVRLLREAGIRALSGSQVARHAGLSQSHLTYYFPRRTDLLVALASGRQAGVEAPEHLAPLVGVAPAVLLAIVLVLAPVRYTVTPRPKKSGIQRPSRAPATPPTRGSP